jgi:DNA polymerase
MMGAMGLKREDVYIANVLKTRPPDNATPTSDECALCAPFLYEQILIIRPAAIVTLGLPASRTLLNSVESMTRLRGRWHAFTPPTALLTCANASGLPEDWSVPVMPTYHPAFLLRSYTAENRGKVWSDLQQVMQRLGLIGGPARSTGVGV